jgi:hypothetical protein
MYYQPLLILHFAFVANITLLHVTAAFPVPLLDYAWIISFKVGGRAVEAGKCVVH